MNKNLVIGDLSCPILVFDLSQHKIITNSVFDKLFMHNSEDKQTLLENILSSAELAKLLEKKETCLATKAPVLLNINSVKNTRYLILLIPALADSTEIIGIYSIWLSDSILGNIELFNDKYKNILDNLLDSLPVFVYWKNRASKFEGCNNLLAELAGLEKSEDLIGKDDFSVTTKERALEIRQHDLSVLKTGKPTTVEEIVHSPKGRNLICASYKAPFRDKHGNITGIIGVSTDITKLRETQKALKKAKKEAEAGNQAKTEFLENMRHSIRTPITGLLGLCDYIINKSSQSDVIDCAKHQKDGIEAILYIHNQILEAARVADGVVPFNDNKFYFKELVKHVEGLGRPIASHKHIHFNVDYDDNIPEIVVGDLRRLFRVLFELMGNALEFTAQGEVAVTISLAICDLEKRQAVISVTVADTGVGIASDKQEAIFNTFKRLTPSHKGTHRGVGMGLSITKQYMDDIGGEIYLTQSEIGKGTTFVCQIPVKLPLTQDDVGLTTDFDYLRPLDCITPPSTTGLATPEVGQTETVRSHVLIVEDDPMAAFAVKNMLISHQCTVDVAETGEKALDLFKTTAYDLIFMDLGLPGIGGEEVTRQIRTIEWQRDSHVPILALSAHVDDPKTRENCMKVGMDAVFRKPLDVDKVSSILQSFIPTRGPNESVSAGTISTDDTIAVQQDSIDLALAAKTLGVDDDAKVREMITMYYGHMAEELVPIEAAYAEKDWTTVQKLTHKMKGATSYIGLVRLHQACKQIEQAIKAGDTDHYEPFYAQFLTEVANFQEAYVALPPISDNE